MTQTKDEKNLANNGPKYCTSFHLLARKQDPDQQNGNKFAIAKGNKDVEEKRFNAGVEKKPDKFYINNSLL